MNAKSFAKGATMNKILFILALSVFFTVTANAGEAEATKVELKSGSTLFLHPDGTSRMVNAHGKAVAMDDGVEMETADGTTILMKNKKIWVRWGGPGKGGEALRAD